MIKKIIRVGRNDDLDREDRFFWEKTDPRDRLSSLEMYRRDYWGENYADESGFPRIFKIVKHS